MKRRLTPVLLVGITGALASCSTGVPPVPTLEALNDAEASAIYAAEADFAWGGVLSRFPDAERPDAKLAKAMPLEERDAAIADCLQNAGYASKVAPGGGYITEGIPAGQQSAFAVAEYVCGVEYPFDAELNRAPTDEQLRWLYHYYRHELTQCLEEAGFPQTGDAPSEETFIEGLNGQGDPWTPFFAVPSSISTADLAKLQGNCPEYPEEYYGG